MMTSQPPADYDLERILHDAGSRQGVGRFLRGPDRETMKVTLNSSSLAERFLALNVGDQVKGP